MKTFALYTEHNEQRVESENQLVDALNRLQAESRSMPYPKLATLECSNGESITFGFSGEKCVVGTSDINKVGHISSDSNNIDSKEAVTFMLDGEPTEVFRRYLISSELGKRAVSDFYSKGILHSSVVTWQLT